MLIGLSFGNEYETNVACQATDLKMLSELHKEMNSTFSYIC